MHKTLTFENLLKSVEVRLDYGSPDVVSLPAPAAAAISTSFSAFTAHVWFVVRNVLRRRWTYSFDRSRNYRRVCHVSLLHYPVKLLHFGPPVVLDFCVLVACNLLSICHICNFISSFSDSRKKATNKQARSGN